MPRVLERGTISFAFRPRVNEPDPNGLEDVQRFFVILLPAGRRTYRRLVVGRKRLPTPALHERHWAYVDRASATREDLERDLEEARYRTRTQGPRTQPAGRLAGEGIYAFVEHAEHVHLVYELEVPATRGEVQEDLGVEPAASYVVVALLRGRDRRFAPFQVELLDREGAELVLIGAGDSPPAGLGLRLDPGRERAVATRLFESLELGSKWQ